MIKSHYIYLLSNNNNLGRYLSYTVHKIGRKIGSTCNMKSRMRSYLTGHPDKVPLECYYNILNPELYTCYQIDNMIKNNFDDVRLKAGGGIEFYEADKVTQEVLEKFFDKMGIIWEKLFEIIDENTHKMTKEDFENLIYDNDNLYPTVPDEIILTKTNTLLNKYIEKIKERDIIKELLNSDENLFNYLLTNYDDSNIEYFIENNMIDDQIEILLTSILYYQYYDSGIWNLFCRYGKTMLSCLLCNTELKYKKILVLVPSLYLVNQTYNTWIKHWPINIIKKVCCEENLSSDEEIYEFYNDNENCIFISTYHSSEKFNDYKFDFCIFDEAHRTAGSKYDSKTVLKSSDSEEENDKQKIKTFKLLLENKNIKQKLFLTATKKVYNDNNDGVYCMDDEAIYGKTIASVSAIRAKELNRICSYKVMTIKTTPIEIDFNIEEFFIENNLADHQINKLRNLKERYIMFAKGLIDCMRKNKIKHVITFHEYIINCKFFSKILEHINNTEKLLNSVEFITGNDKKNIRKQIINDFQDIDYSILCSAKVLQEGVDIPKCDGVIFIDNKTSNIDITQALSRCLTYIENKQSYVMIPYIDGDDLINDEKTNDLRLLLRNISEIDENIQEYFKKYIEIDFESKTKEETETDMKLLNLKYNINVDLDLINELKEISYLPYKQAKELIKNKYSDLNDYKNKIEEFNKEIPVDADLVYKRFGWKNWNEYLGLENKMTLLKISKLIQNENERRKKLLNGKLTVTQAIKYILYKNNSQMLPKDICNEILEYNICRSLDGLTPDATVSSLCGTLYRTNSIKRSEDQPRKYSYNDYNEFETIDTKEKYLDFCKNKVPELEQDILPDNGNWIKFCLPNYDELVDNYYSYEEFQQKMDDCKISTEEQYRSECVTDNLFPSFEYLTNGFYDDPNFNINDLYYKKRIRRD